MMPLFLSLLFLSALLQWNKGKREKSERKKRAKEKNKEGTKQKRDNFN